MPQTITPTADGTGLIRLDAMLVPYATKLRERYWHFGQALHRIDKTGGLLGPISQGHKYFGFNRGKYLEASGVWYREWAPGALQLRLIGDFNNWDRYDCPLVRDQFGVWSIFLPDEKYADKLVHGSRVKVTVVNESSKSLDRIPAYIQRAVQEADMQFVGQYWNPPEKFEFQHERPELHGGLRIYEAHVGMAQEEGKVGTYEEFTRNILPRIANLDYNAVQLMAIQEHPYYGSFGYHVSNFYAPSSRFGTPEELKELVDTAHSYGLRVLLDMVHSHAVKNTMEGLNEFDGTDHQYFHAGPRGHHDLWDSNCSTTRSLKCSDFS